MELREMSAREFMILGMESDKFDKAVIAILEEYQLVDAVDEILLIADRYRVEVERTEMIDFLVDCADEVVKLPYYEKCALFGNEEPGPSDLNLLGHLHFKKTTPRDGAANSNDGEPSVTPAKYYHSLSR